MATKRTIKASDLDPEQRQAKEIDLAEGGTVGVLEMAWDDATRYSELTSRVEFERDGEGIVFNARYGSPEKKAADTTDEQIELAVALTAFITNLEAEDHTPIELTRSREDDLAKIRAFLCLPTLAEVELAAPANWNNKATGERELQPQQPFLFLTGQVRAADIPKKERDAKKIATSAEIAEPIWRMVIRESMRMRLQRTAVVRKNS